MKYQTSLRITRALILLMVVGLSGCATYLENARVYTPNDSLQSQRTTRATIVNIRPVQLRSHTGRTGAVLGGVGGAAAGSAVGHGAGRYIAAAVGGLVGLVVGSRVEKTVKQPTSGLQITVRGQRGRLHTVVQPDDGTSYHTGQQVLVIQGGHNTRISPLS